MNEPENFLFSKIKDLESLATRSFTYPGALDEHYASSDTFPWENCAFGYELNPDGDNTAEVRIYAGTVNGVAIAETKVVCSTGANCVYARVAKAAGGAGTIQVAGSLPAEDATYYYYDLYTFAVTSGVVAFTKANRPFNIETGRQLPSNANATQYHVLQISATVGAADDPTKWTIGTVKWI